MSSIQPSTELPRYVTRRSDSGIFVETTGTRLMSEGRSFSVPDILSQGLLALWNLLPRCTNVNDLIVRAQRQEVPHAALLIRYLLRTGVLADTGPFLAEHPNRDGLLDLAESLGLSSFDDAIEIPELRVVLFGVRGPGITVGQRIAGFGFKLTLAIDEGYVDHRDSHFGVPENMIGIPRTEALKHMLSTDADCYKITSFSTSEDLSIRTIVEANDVVIGCATASNDPFLAYLNTLCWNAATPLVPVVVTRYGCSVGASVLPPSTPCIACDQRRRSLHTSGYGTPRYSHGAGTAFLQTAYLTNEGRGLAEISGWIGGLESIRVVIEPSIAKTLGRVWTFSVDTLKADIKGILKDPECEVCMRESRPRGAIWMPKPSAEDLQAVGL